MSVAHSTWRSVKLEELAALEPHAFRIGPFGSALKKGELVEEGIPVCGIENVLPNSFSSQFRKFVTQRKFQDLSNYVARPGDVMVTTMGTVGRAAVVPEGVGDLIFDSHLFRMRLDPSVAYPAYVAYAINGFSGLASEIKRRSTGSIMAGLNTTILRTCSIPLPPIEEQRRIAAILDEADALRMKRREAIAKLDELPQAIFYEMFGDPVTNPMAWPVQDLGHIADFYAGGTLPSGVTFGGQPSGALLLKVSDLNRPGNERAINGAQLWSPAGGNRAATCPPGSIVMPKRGGAIGTNKKRLAVRTSVLDPNLMGVKGHSEILDDSFLFAWFQQFDLTSIASGSSVPQLNKQDLAPLRVAVPPLAAQRLFAQRVTEIEKSVKAVHQSAKAFDELFSTLEYHAFRGEL